MESKKLSGFYRFFKNKKNITTWKTDTTVKIMATANISKDSIIGSYSYVGRNTTITKTEIGRYCSIADNVTIGAGEHDMSRISTSSLFYEEPYEQLTRGACVIGPDVWVGVDAIIRRGVVVGLGAVIGANSFVNTDVPDFAIVAGTPARVLRYRFTPETQEKIRRSRWWEEELGEARTLINALENNNSLLD